MEARLAPAGVQITEEIGPPDLTRQLNRLDQSRRPVGRLARLLRCAVKVEEGSLRAGAAG